MSLPQSNPAYWYQRNSGGLVVAASERSLNVSATESAGWLFPAIDAAALAQVNLVHLWLAATGFSAQEVRLRLVGSPLASAAEWDATVTTPVTQSTVGSPGAPAGTNYKIDVTDAFRLAWTAAGRGAIPGVEIRVSSPTAIGVGTAQLATLQYVLGRQFYPTTGTSTFGSQTIQQTRTLVESKGLISLESATRSKTRSPSTGTVAVGGSARYGLIYATSGAVAFGGDIDFIVRWRTNGGVAFGGATRASNRFLVPLRLAARVTSDVGYMWIPVYLQLPVDDHVSDKPWEFFYPSGRKIPHLIRNIIGHQVRALVYMRPSVTQAQDFFCRVG